MTTIQTAAGAIDSSELGRTLVHEHIVVIGQEFRDNFIDDWDEDARVADAVRKLTELATFGIDSIMDPTVMGLGRYIPRVAQIATQVDINILVATGVYTYKDLPVQFLYTGPGLLFEAPEPLTAAFIRDITEGIPNTNVRAAFLKCAIDTPGLTHDVERIMRAVGQASVQTGAPITVHTHPESESGLVAQRVLKEEGVDLRKVVIGHSGDTTDVDYLMRVADQGSLLGMDRFGLDVMLPTAERVKTIAELVRRGYVESIVVSHDAACFNDTFDADQCARMVPNWNYRHIPQDVIPALLREGLTQDDIDTILVKNPRRHFEPA
jgi:phosphotriesterase-related protein